jgi:hypothetical protein
LSWNLGSSASWKPQGPSRPVMGLLCLLPGFICRPENWQFWGEYLGYFSEPPFIFFDSLVLKVKGIFVRVRAMKAYRGGEGLFNFLTSTLITSLVSFTPLPHCFWRKVTRCSLNTRLGESLSSSGCFWEEKQSYRTWDARHDHSDVQPVIYSLYWRWFPRVSSVCISFS